MSLNPHGDTTLPPQTLNPLGDTTLSPQTLNLIGDTTLSPQTLNPFGDTTLPTQAPTTPLETTHSPHRPPQPSCRTPHPALHDAPPLTFSHALYGVPPPLSHLVMICTVPLHLTCNNNNQSPPPTSHKALLYTVPLPPILSYASYCALTYGQALPNSHITSSTIEHGGGRFPGRFKPTGVLGTTLGQVNHPSLIIIIVALEQPAFSDLALFGPCVEVGFSE